MLNEYGPLFTCADILKLPQLEGVLLRAGSEGLTHQIARVNVMEVPDVVEWVRPGEFLMTTGYPFRNNPQALVEMIPLLAQKGLAALGIKTKRYMNEIPQEALDLADMYNLPIFELPPQTVFSDVQREIMEYVLMNEAKELTQLQNRIGHLTKQMLTGISLESVMADLAEVLGNPLILVEGDLIKLYGKSLPLSYDEETEIPWKEIQSGLREGMNRVEINGRPLNLHLTLFNNRENKEISSSLIVAEWNHSLSNLDLLTLERMSVFIRMEMINRQTRNEVEFKYKDQFLYDWLSGRLGTETDVHSRAEASGVLLAEGFQYTVVIVRWLQNKPDYKGLQQMIRQLRSKAWSEHGIHVVILEEELVWILSHSESQPSAGVLEEIAIALRESAPQQITGACCSLCIGKQAAMPLAVLESYMQAKQVHRISQVTGVDDLYVTLDQLGAYQLLYLLADHSEARTFRDRYTLPLLEYEVKHDTLLLQTLKTYFANNLNIRKTAGALFTHYNTVVHRLERVSEILELQLDDAEKRLQLELAVKLHYMDIKKEGIQ
ncbi:PucR family transcriptional regulator [Paenibacillus sp. UNC451MF]|uniref:PucR family transcriptional regulator n=1 Tax=Paenibacillus sp. UNC451MF TaxID=1449063 RepID=UPI00048D6F6C|nr:PucR family transcriptional regulator [Paenibacillus sp. UNC451MF]